MVVNAGEKFEWEKLNRRSEKVQFFTAQGGGAAFNPRYLTGG
jgi:hypothetical protein